MLPVPHHAPIWSLVFYQEKNWTNRKCNLCHREPSVSHSFVQSHSLKHEIIGHSHAVTAKRHSVTSHIISLWVVKRLCQMKIRIWQSNYFIFNSRQLVFSPFIHSFIRVFGLQDGATSKPVKSRSVKMFSMSNWSIFYTEDTSPCSLLVEFFVLYWH